MRKPSLCFFLLSAALVTLLVLSLSGCYQPGGPVPENPGPSAPRSWTPAQVNSLVRMDEQTIYSPAPRDNGVPPRDCDYIHFLRFRLRTRNNPAKADAVLVLMPGLLSGNNAFWYLGRQIVYMAKTQKHMNLEIWAPERRANQLEDLTGLDAAEKARNTQVAIDYYYHGATINGRKFAGFLTERDVPYLSEFGLKLEIEDTYKLITTMMPDAAMRRKKLFVGGHSLGGPLAYYFAGWDFDGNPATTADAGYRNCAGLVSLDSLIAPTMPTGWSSLSTGPASSATGTGPGNAVSDEQYYTNIVGAMRRGGLPRLLQMVVVNPEILALDELVAMEANLHPDEESTLMKRLPVSPYVEGVLKTLYSRTAEDFMIGRPAIKDFRFTNEALFGAMMDDNSMPISLLQASMGFPNGGAVVPKDFPLPSGVGQAPWLVDLLGGFPSRAKLFIANDAGPSYETLGTGPLYGWTNFDEVGNKSDPNYSSRDGSVIYTSTGQEVSDMQDVAKVVYAGPSNIAEWYFTTRIMLDINFARKPWAKKFGMYFMHADKIDGLPKIEFITAKGPTKTNLDRPPAVTGKPIEGYSHLDVLAAAADRPARRPNEVLMPLINFMIKNKSATKN
jgi:hypothetical protein